MKEKKNKIQRLHPILVRQVAEALHEIFMQDRYADKVLEKTLKANKKAGSTDRSFIASTVYDVVRNYRFLNFILGNEAKKISDFWRLIGIHLTLNGLDLPEWTEFRGLDRAHIETKAEEGRQIRAVRESIPDWMDELCQSELGDVWEPTLAKLNETADVVLRCNTLHKTREELMEALEKEGVMTEALPDETALRLVLRKNVFRTAAFQKGWFEVQDFSSQMVAPLLAPEAGMRVVDACAGAGGKTLHLATLMQNKGRLIALDTLSWKLGELLKRAKRAGVHNIETRAIENNKVIKRLHESADRLLLDVPCSGLGVLRRNPDSKWKLKPEFIDNIKETQQQILQDYSGICKSGGRMVYATCSILPSENNHQVLKFLASNKGKEFHLIEEKTILPQDSGFDGFYMALLEKE